jgi:hypothetical protein
MIHKWIFYFSLKTGKFNITKDRKIKLNTPIEWQLLTCFFHRTNLMKTKEIETQKKRIKHNNLLMASFFNEF